MLRILEFLDWQLARMFESGSAVPTLKKDEYLAMLDWSVDQKEHPVMILIPGNQVTYRGSR